MKSKNTLGLPSKTFALQRESLIVALSIVSESEIQAVKPEFNSTWETQNPTEFNQILYELGMDTTRPIGKQSNLIHRNRLNQVVQCPRWLGFERQDIDWIESGYASKEAKDKFSGNRILEDLYRARMLTQDAQETLEDRDRHTIIDESTWE